MKLEWIIRGDSENDEKRVVVCEAICDFWSRKWAEGSYDKVTVNPVIKLLYHDYKVDVMKEIKGYEQQGKVRIQTKGRRFTASFPSFVRYPDIMYRSDQSVKGLFGVSYKEMTLEYAQAKAQQELKERLQILMSQL